MAKTQKVICHLLSAIRQMKYLALYPIYFYQRFISRGLPSACRFQPTCSQYAVEAIDRFGLLKGGALALKRIASCHPFHAPGFDPVPYKE